MTVVAGDRPQSEQTLTSQAFYRKWRSQRFADLVGQEPIARTLRNAVRGERIAHAYLFCGPRGVGKTSAARILAKSVNCPNAVDGEPCAVCQNCQAIGEGRAIDVVELDAASNRGIDQIREIRERVGLSPATLRYKFYILDEAHMLTTEACNALLKTLEEPPPHAIFVLVTTDPQRLPETIVSRCQRLDFRRITLVDAVGRLSYVCQQEGIDPESGVLEMLARFAGGSLRDAEGALDQIVAYAGPHPTLESARTVLGVAGPEAGREVIRYLVDGQAAGAIRLVNELADSGADTRQVALDVVETLRGILLLQTSESLANLVDVGPETLEDLRALSTRLKPSQVIGMIRAFTPGPNTRGNLRPQLPLELSVVESAELLHATPAASHASEAPIVAPPPPASVPPTGALTDPRSGVSGRPATSLPPVNGSPPKTVTATPPPTAPAPESPPAELRAPQAGILFPEAQRRWNEILEACGIRSRSVQALLRSGRPVDAENETLVLGFPYPFHRERIDDVKNRVVVEEAIARVLGQKVLVRCVISTREELAAQDPTHAALDDPVVKAAVGLGARVRQVVEETSEEQT